MSKEVFDSLLRRIETVTDETRERLQREWVGTVECPHCKADLRDQVNGPPYKRTIARYCRDRDRTVAWICPDCEKEWAR